MENVLTANEHITAIKEVLEEEAKAIRSLIGNVNQEMARIIEDNTCM